MVDEHCYQHLDHGQLSSDQDIGLLEDLPQGHMVIAKVASIGATTSL
jgi:hypothetical protein